MTGRSSLLVLCFALLATLAAPVAAAPLVPLRPIEGIAVDPPPQVSAITWILYDDTYDLVLASEGADQERAMASTTKIMTAMVAFENSTPDQTVVVSDLAAEVGEAEVGLVPGEIVELGPLTTGLLVRSGNDAAIALAEGVAGSEEAFVGLMNAKAEELGLEHTHFENPHGLDEDGHYTSAADLLTTALAAMEMPEFAAAVGSKVYRFPPDPDGTARVVDNTNMLLWDYEGAIGVKTGFTNNAGMVLVAAAERDGRRLYAVVMGSARETGHFTDAAALLDYGFDSFGLVPLIIEGEAYGLQRIGDTEEPLQAAATVEAFVHIAAAGVLAPELTLVDGVPSLVVGEEGEPAPVDIEETTLPTGSDALWWFRQWLGGDG